MHGVSNAQLDQDAKRRIARAVAGGQTLRDPAEAEAAVRLARSAERRLRARTVPSALMVSAGTTLVWLLVVALPATLGSGVHLSALLAGLGVGMLLFAVILLLGERQIRLVRRAEQGNQRMLDSRRGHR
jgi:amino acid permease